MPQNHGVDVSIPKGYKAVFTFSCSAVWPQQLEIGYHNAEGHIESVAKRSNQSLDDWETPVNQSERDKIYTVSAQYLDKYKRWQKSDVRKQHIGNSYKIGFDDGFDDDDYNDITTTYSLIKVH